MTRCGEWFIKMANGLSWSKRTAGGLLGFGGIGGNMASAECVDAMTEMGLGLFCRIADGGTGAVACMGALVGRAWFCCDIERIRSAACCAVSVGYVCATGCDAVWLWF